MDTLPFTNLSNSNLATIMAGDPEVPKAGSSAVAVRQHRVPGSYAKRKAKAEVVPYGHASVDVCESVFRAILTGYGVGGSSEGGRDEFLWCLAETFIHGTSAEIGWDNVWFTFEGSRHSMAILAAEVGRYIGLINPVRVWVRDFRRGELPMRMFEFLNNPDNTELRQSVAANYGTTVDNARFCFDTSGALISSGLTLSHADIAMVNMLSTYTITRAQQDGQSRGDTQASSARAGMVGGTRAGEAPALAGSPAAPAERGAFRSLRG